jgi:hypothetical protein
MPITGRLKDPNQFKVNAFEMDELSHACAWGIFHGTSFLRISYFLRQNHRPLVFGEYLIEELNKKKH